jgi:hypothetical protein
MKPGPRSFSQGSLVTNGLESDSIPLNSSVWRKVRSRENWLILIWPCIVFHGPLYTWRRENVWARKTWCPTWYGSFHLIKLFNTFYAYMFHRIEYFTLFFLFQVNHGKIFFSLLFLWSCGNKNGFLSIQISCIYTFNTSVIVGSRSNGWENTQIILKAYLIKIG